MTPLDNLTLKAAALARVAPDLWRDYVSAIADFAEIHRDNLVKSPLPDLPVNQGRAQIMSAFHKSMAECLANSDKIKKGTPK